MKGIVNKFDKGIKLITVFVLLICSVLLINYIK